MAGDRKTYFGSVTSEGIVFVVGIVKFNFSDSVNS